MNTTPKRSPLKQAPLRNPGESLSQQIMSFIEDQVMPYLLGCVIFFGITISEWYHAIGNIPPRPWPMTVITGGLVAFTIYKVITTRHKLRYMKQGLYAEKFVGQFIDSLSIPGLRVFHDVPGNGFNLDHVVVSPSGIFVIETKAPSKPLRGQTLVIHDGHHIEVNGYQTDEPLIQVRAAAGWLRDLLKSGTSKVFRIQPVVVYPDWYVKETRPPERASIRVVNHQFLPGMFSSHVELEEHEVAMAADHLARYIRSQQG